MAALVALQPHRATSLAVDSSIPGLTPFVKWAGGKGSLLRYLQPFIPDYFDNYYEPFLGGGALFFALCGRTTRFRAFLTDTNQELINAYRIIKSEPEDLIRSVSGLRKQYNAASNQEDLYYEIRSWEPTDPIEWAARFIFLNKTCYNGLYRVNPRGEFNVPFGHHKRPKIFDETNIMGISRALRKTHATVRAIDYQKAIVKCQAGDFVYLDPPYHPTSKTSSFTDYTPNGFDEEDQRKLAVEFARLREHGSRVLLSNSDTRLVRKLYYSYYRKSVSVNRPISCVGTGRTGFKELIIFGHMRNKTSIGQGTFSSRQGVFDARELTI